MHSFRQEFNAAGVRIRVDVNSREPMQSLLQGMDFLNYRLAGVELVKEVTKAEPDLVWQRQKEKKEIDYRQGQVHLTGDWQEGEIQKILVSLLAKHMFEQGLYLFHASAVQYRDKSIMFLGGESNSGKTMSQIEACRRGGRIISTETIVTDESGNVVMGSKNVFLRVRTKGTERIDKPDQDEGVSLFFSKTPEFELHTGPANIDLVVVPDIDGHFSTLVGEMSGFEKQYQTFHCLCDYLGMHLLLDTSLPMPMFDSEELRRQRANFIARFTAKRPYYFIRGRDPGIVVDELDKILDAGGK